MKLSIVLLVLIGLGICAGGVRPAFGETLPAALVPAEVEKRTGYREVVGGAFPGLLLAPLEAADDADEKNHQPYHAVCGVYAAETANGAVVRYVRRFLVHAPDADSLPLAKRTAKLLLILHGEERERLGFAHPKSAATVDVWLSGQAGAGRDADTGGEQFGSQIYLYQIFTERSPTEWVRETAHEYGHFALPGVTGFTEPEAWANGVLGERLFLKWLREDTLRDRLKSADIPFMTAAQLSDYESRQIAPLVQKVALSGPDVKGLARKDAAGMDALIGLVLACDSLYGSRQLRDIFACMGSSRGDGFLTAPDFLRGVSVSLSGSADWTLAPPLSETGGKFQTFTAFLPVGVWDVSTGGAVRWKLTETTRGLTSTPTLLTVHVPGWRKITVTRTGAKAPALTFHNRTK